MHLFRIVKKNLKYFSALTESGHHCRIVIDDNSRELGIGEHMLEVEDLSVYTKYGSDLIFKLKASADQVREAGICTLKSRYNQLLVDEARRLGGKWDETAGAWVFSRLVMDKVEELDRIFNDNEIPVEITFLSPLYGDCAPVFFCGYMIAKAWGRDSGAYLGDGIAIIDGSVDSGGSVKNWHTIVNRGTVIRMYLSEGILWIAEKETYVKIKRLSIPIEFKNSELEDQFA